MGATLEVLPAFMEAAPTGPRDQAVICCRLDSSPPWSGVEGCLHPAPPSRLSRAPSNNQGRLHGAPQEGLRGWGHLLRTHPWPLLICEWT